jgi:transposase InsO family protein
LGATGWVYGERQASKKKEKEEVIKLVNRLTQQATYTRKGRIITMSGFLTSRAYVWRRGIRDRVQPVCRLYKDEVNAAVHNIISYPHMGGKKGALMLAYHQLEYIGQRCYDGIKSVLRLILYAEIKDRKLERETVAWPKPCARHYGEIWNADFTHVELYGQVIYIAVVLDDFSHYYLGHSVSDCADASLVDDAFSMALKTCGGVLPEICMINDRGSQYKADLYRARVGHYGIKHVFIPAGTPWNNGEAEVGMKDIKALVYQRLSHTPRERGQDIVGIARGIVHDMFKELNETIPRPKLAGVTPADIVENRAEDKRSATKAFIEERKAARPSKKRVDNVSQHIKALLKVDTWTDRSVKNLVHLMNHKYNLVVPQKV